MTIVKTTSGYNFLNLDILGPNEDEYLIYQHHTSDLIDLMAKSFLSPEFIVDFGMFWYFVDESSITCIRLHEYPAFIKKLKEQNLEIKHCTTVFKDCGHIPKIRYNRDKYGKVLKNYRWFTTYILHRA